MGTKLQYPPENNDWLRGLTRKFSGDGVWISCTLVLGIALISAAVFRTPLLNDDLVNVNIRAIAASEGQGLLGKILTETSAWMQLQGRFFPGAFFWTYGLFGLTQNVIVYKMVLIILLGGAFITVGLLVRSTARNNYLAALVGIVLIGLLSIRVGHDAITSYTGLVPLVIMLSCSSALLMIWGNGRWFVAIPATLLYSSSLVTYEVVILLAPILALLVWLRLRKPIAYIVFLVPAFVQAGIAFYLRSALQVGTTVPAYTVSLDPGSVLLTFAKQASAALPMAQWLFGEAPGIPPFSIALFLVTAIIFLLPAFIGTWLILSSPAINQIKTLTLGLMAIVGLWAWISTAALTAITARWQHELVWGTGYLNVVFGYVGMGLCLSSLLCWIEISMRRNRAPEKVAVLVRICCAGFVALLSVATIAGNFTLLSVIA